MADTIAFPARLERLADGHADPEELTGMVRAVLGSAPDSLSRAEAALLTEIEALAAMIAGARAEVAALGADDITAGHIPAATDELDAIVTQTAAATDSILGACERLEALEVGLAGADRQALRTCVTCIYESCSFQDITGQRIAKVVAALQAIERRVAHMIGVFAPERPPTAVPAGIAAPQLVNGPQLPAFAMHQCDVDALLASLD